MAGAQALASLMRFSHTSHCHTSAHPFPSGVESRVNQTTDDWKVGGRGG